MITEVDTQEKVKESIVNLLKAGIQINFDANVSCYQDAEGHFNVEYWLEENAKSCLELTDEQKRMLEEEEELLEVFDEPEPAAEYFLKLWAGTPKGREKIEKRCLKQKISNYDKDRYF